MAKIFESQLSLITGIFGAKNTDNVFLILILDGSSFCLQWFRQSFKYSLQYLSAICQSFLKKQTSCLHICKVRLEVKIMCYRLFE